MKSSNLFLGMIKCAIISILFYPSLVLAHLISITATVPFPASMNVSATATAIYTVTNITSKIPITVVDQSQFPDGLSITSSSCGQPMNPGQSCIIQLRLNAPSSPGTFSATLKEWAKPSADGVTSPILVTIQQASSQFTVTPSAGTGGSISPNTPQTVSPGSSKTFTATPNSGFIINEWQIDGSLAQTGGSSLTLNNITANHTVAVSFTEQFTVTPSAGTGGSISPNTPQTVSPGSSKTFTATPNSGFIINEWRVDGSLAQTGGSSFTLNNITANHTVAVSFTAQYTVTPSAGTGGSISPSTPQTVSSGDSLVFTATPDSGFSVNQWQVDGTLVQTGGTSFTLNNITANHTVTVSFSGPVTSIAAGQNNTDFSALLAISTNSSSSWANQPVSGLPVEGLYRAAACTGTGVNTVCLATGSTFNGVTDDTLIARNAVGNINNWSALVASVPNVPLFSAAATGSGSTAILVAGGGGASNVPTLLVSRNGGVNFTEITTPVLTSSLGTLNTASCVGSGDTAICIAAGEGNNGTVNQLLFVSRDGGSTWTAPTIAGLGSDTTIFNGGSCTGTGSSAVCAVVGKDNSTNTPLVIVSTDGGQSWSTKAVSGALPGSTLFTSVSCTGAGASAVCAAAGRSLGPIPIVIASTDGGATWSVQSVVPSVPLGRLNSISCLETVCAAVGVDTSSNLPLIITSTNGTASWRSETVGLLTGEFYGANCSGGGTNIICTAAGGVGAPFLATSTNAGVSWGIQSVSGMPVSGDFFAAGGTASPLEKSRQAIKNHKAPS